VPAAPLVSLAALQRLPQQGELRVAQCLQLAEPFLPEVVVKAFHQLAGRFIIHLP
jgi:hypothetical protein